MEKFEFHNSCLPSPPPGTFVLVECHQIGERYLGKTVRKKEGGKEQKRMKGKKTKKDKEKERNKDRKRKERKKGERMK